jgi:LysR family transcriptional regulator, nitrogen assimilation regulatory protein
MIDVRNLAYFIAVVEAKSFTAAAEVLCVAQPALSQHLRRLEEEFGHQLLVRHSRGVEPTQAGLRLVEHARSILKSVESAKQDIRNFDEQPHGRVRVGLPPSLCEWLALDLMTDWPREHPNVELQIVEQSSNTLTEWVLAGRLGLAVTSFPADSSMVVAEPLLQDKMFAVMPGPADSRGLEEIRFADVTREPLILFSNENVSRQLIEMTAKYCSLQLNIAYEIDSADLTLKLVEANFGSTIQPYLAVRKYMASGRATVRLIVGPSITRRLHLLRSRHRPLTTDEMHVSDAIKSHLSRLFASHNPLLELDFLSPT